MLSQMGATWLAATSNTPSAMHLSVLQAIEEQLPYPSSLADLSHLMSQTTFKETYPHLVPKWDSIRDRLCSMFSPNKRLSKEIPTVASVQGMSNPLLVIND